MKKENRSLGEKATMNPKEARAYWNLSGRKFYQFLNEGQFDFVAYYGKRKLIIRDAFEAYLQKNPMIKEALKNGEQYNKKRLETQSPSQR